MQEKGEWLWKPFDALDGDEVYAVLKLRSEIFVVEQNCPYLDADGLDQGAWHCLYRQGDRLLAYLRSLAPGVSYANASAIGRIVIAGEARGRGLSRELIQRGIDFNRQRWPDADLDIGAQAHLRELYESLGFAVVGEPYDEDGIPHLHMRLQRP